MKRDMNHFYGCLIGGAIGDALGAPVEFLPLDEIVEKYGEGGIKQLELNGKSAIITDDTQLTLFTAEGLLRAVTRRSQKGIEKNTRDTTMTVFRAYLRWLYTQGLSTPHWGKNAYDGWLVGVKKLHAYREPGVTCITSLGKGMMGSIMNPINDSKGCGTVIRVAPVGLFEAEEDVYEVGCSIGAITHGHPTGYTASGALALLIFYLMEGHQLEDAVHKLIAHLSSKADASECLEQVSKALSLAKQGEPSVEKIGEIGLGFMAEEALAIGIYCALSYPDDFKKAIILAANHDGDSDSTAAITGNILGAYIGAEAIEEDWQKQIEVQKEIYSLAADLLTGYEDTDTWKKRYPGW